MIELKNISKVFRTKDVETTALENVNLEVEKGEFVSIMGPSGCGKSTLLNIIGLLSTPTTGSVKILGTDCNKMADTELAHFRNKNLGFVFQSFHLIPSLSVAANVELPLGYRSGLSASQRRERVEEVLRRLEMSHRIKHLPSQLSGGQCQRVAIARAIVGAPSIILADEPTGNLDSRMGAEVMSLLHRLNKEDGITIVMVTHNEAQAEQTDRIIRFFDGRVIS
ncbi:ABC transporter ATP-binding protein [Duncaniella dubosii]|uniref:ABC transporter ATP-binding protein n=1 Tax=Duncaniella dubosii TaxID=2518971 RepID=UPI0023EFC0B5|nr:ABC transporter ATP-binding protein [Duncaniella dubosii]MCX4283706.1 ABC transporter ATP-binding protein [Duncaniella dubosii]